MMSGTIISFVILFLTLVYVSLSMDLPMLIYSQQQLLSSDHYGITFKLASSLPPSKLPTYYTFNYSKGDYIGLSNYLLGIDFTPCFQSHDVQEIWCIIEQFIINAMNFSFL